VRHDSLSEAASSGLGFLRCEEWPKHVIIIIINRIQDSCVLTYPTPSLMAYNTNNNNNNNNNVITIVISSMAVIPKSLSQSLTTLNLHPNTYI